MHAIPDIFLTLIGKHISNIFAKKQKGGLCHQPGFEPTRPMLIVVQI